MENGRLARTGNPLHPDAAIASAIASRLMDWDGAEAERFTTGSAHYVYEVRPDNGAAPIVIRLGMEEQRRAMQDGVGLMMALRNLTVPLPRILGYGTEGALPWTALERLPGNDLGHCIADLPDRRLREIAKAVAKAQASTAEIGVARRYGYAVTAERAPFRTWSEVVRANLERSRRRMSDAGLFDLATLDPVEHLLDARRGALDAQPALPFLHDTTTKNVIVTPEGRFSGIVDVDDLCFGDPRWAPALTLAALLAYGGPTQYVDYWMGAAGHAADSTFRLYVVVFLLDLMAEHGHAFNGNQATSTPTARLVIETAFRRALSQALD